MTRARHTLGKTPWVDRTYARVCAYLAHKVDPTWLPLELPMRKCSVDEYGCGSYGCASPTHDPKVTIKLTTDQSEANFVAHLVQSGISKNLPGIVEHFAIYQTPVVHRARPVFVLWRESVSKPEILYKMKAYRIIAQLLDTKRAGDKVYRMLKNLGVERAAAVLDVLNRPSVSADGGLRQTAYALRDRLQLWEETRGTLFGFEATYEIAWALERIEKFGFLIADTHAGNVGLIEPDRFALFDPGHAVPLRSELMVARVEVL